MQNDLKKHYESPVRHDATDDQGTPNLARFILDADDARNILKLSLLVKENDLYKVERWDYRVVYLKTNEDGDEDEFDVIGTDLDTLLVTESEFQFTGSVRHTDVKVVTNRFPITDLIQFFGTEVTAPLPSLNIAEGN